MIGDIDILVESNHLYKAEHLLKEVNYNSQEQTLFGKHKKHRHLPRLIHAEHLGAVEIHSKLLRKEKQNLLTVNTILANQEPSNNFSISTLGKDFNLET